MRDIGLIGESLELKHVFEFGLGNIYKQYYSNDARICIELTNEDYVYCDFYNYDETINSYEESNELAKFKKTVPFIHPQSIRVLYKDSKVLKEFISRLNFPRELFVDDDHGNIMSISEFKKRIELNYG